MQDTNWAALGRFCRSVNWELEYPQLLRALLAEILRVVDAAETAVLFIYRPGPDRLVVHSTRGYQSRAVEGMSLRPGEPIAGQVFASGKTAWHPAEEDVAAALAGMSADNRACLSDAVPDLRHPRSVLCLPLDCGEDRLGAVSLEVWHGERGFSEADVELAETLASLAALAADRARLLREVEHQQAVLEQASLLNQDMMGTLSHEMRTPLASIKGYASALMLEGVEWDKAVQHDYLDIIVQESDRLAEIIADLLEVSMIDAGHLAITREPTMLPRLAQEIVDEIGHRAPRHRFLVSFPVGFPIVDADGGRLRRVLFNLLDNAVKYSAGGGLVVVQGQARDNEVVVSVADQGPGIAPEYLNRLFERFFRVKFVDGRHVVGSGLGLPIARNIVEAHGGRIWAESRLGEGTIVYFTLPLGGVSDGVHVAQD
jgi:signal transduction histidine kinase